MFEYDGFLVKMLIKVGNMMIVSFIWLISCIPVITIIPATAALFHTTTKVIRQNGKGVVRDFFMSLRTSLKRGIPLSIICIIFGLLLYTALNFGRQVWQENALWTIYYVFGCFLTFIFLTMLVFAPPTLSRFESGIAVTLVLSLYLASRNLLRSIWFLVLLAFMALLVYIYPITLLILPGLYFDLICGGMEKTLQKFMIERGLAKDEQISIDENVSSVQDETDNIDDELHEMSGLELDNLLDETHEGSLDDGDNNE